MRDVAIILCTWLHLIVMVVWIGHMANAWLLFGPLSRKYVSSNVYGDFIAEYRTKDRPVALSCIAVFIVTGLVMTLLNEQYRGIGNVFANSWSILLFIKHILVLAMIGLGVYQGSRVMPGLAKAGQELAKHNDSDTATQVAKFEKARYRVTQALCTIALIVLLLTAIGEIA